jgi:hypothetical protein
MEPTQMYAIQIGDTQQKALELFGNPTETLSVLGADILQFGSTAPSQAHYVYLKQGIVVVRSISFFGQKKELREYIESYGTPTQSLKKASAGDHDSFDLTVHMWPSKGIAVTTSMSSVSANVVREDTFAPMSLELYLATWGSDLVGHQEATIAATQTTPAAYSSPYSSTFVWGAIVLVLVVLIIFFARRQRRRP